MPPCRSGFPIVVANRYLHGDCAKGQPCPTNARPPGTSSFRSRPSLFFNTSISARSTAILGTGHFCQVGGSRGAKPDIQGRRCEKWKTAIESSEFCCKHRKCMSGARQKRPRSTITSGSVLARACLPPIIQSRRWRAIVLGRFDGLRSQRFIECLDCPSCANGFAIFGPRS